MKNLGVRILSLTLLCALSPVGALKAQTPLTSGIYFIHSTYKNDNRCVDLRTQDNVSIQLFFCNGAKDEKFRVTLTSDGTYTIQAVNAAAGTNLYYVTQSGGSGQIFALHVCTNCDAVRWTIQKANGSPAGSTSMNIITAHAVANVPLRVHQLWNRVDPDGPGRIQLMDPGPPDPHNNWSFEKTQ